MAAVLARADVSYGADLNIASRFKYLLEVLERESQDHRVARRVLRATDEVRAQAQVLGEVLADSEQRIRELAHLERGLREDQRLRIGHLVDACEQRMEDDAIGIVGQRRGWHQTIADFGPQVSEKWEEEQDALVAEIAQALTSHLNKLSRAITEASSAAHHEWSTATPSAPRIEGLRDFRGLWKRRAVGAAVGAGGVLGAALLGAKVGALAGAAFGGPIGAAVGVLVGGLGTALVSPLRKKVQSLFKGKAIILEENRELLRAEIDAVLDDLEKQACAQVDEAFVRIRADLGAAEKQRADAESASLDAADLLARQQQTIRDAMAALDLDTTVCLLEVDGRSRLAGAVKRATRLAGVCIAVEVTDDALAEAWLFPPSSPEIMTFGRPPSPATPGARAAAYVLGLTERVPVSLQARDDDTVVTSDAQVQKPIRAAWSATLSDHLDAQVTIIRPNVVRSHTT